ncbi:MAG: hypothetical protein EBU12_06125, partial [Microbacteriaceae bacterium]|nr:hypothetical protein [Microbacteriaceae bacterium]
MAKSDLLKQAIADAKTVKETALANAKIALQEAFAPRLERMLANKLNSELSEEDEELDADAETMGNDEMDEPQVGAKTTNAMAMGNTKNSSNMPSSVNVGLDFDADGNWDLQGTLDDVELPDDEDDEDVETDEDMTAEYNEGMNVGMSNDEEMGLDEIIAELEGDLESAEMANADDMNSTDPVEESYKKLRSSNIGKKSRKLTEADDEMYEDAIAPEDDLDPEISEIIEAILREEDEELQMPDASNMSEEEKDEIIEELEDELTSKQQDLAEAYRTVKHLRSVINEVNLLNAKLLYTNKLFRNFELSETQKMKVIENFDRAGNTREAKLVFATLAESFKRP